MSISDLRIPGTNTRILVNKIEQQFPNLRVKSAHRILSGWDNIVLVVNNRLIFRFPRFKIAERDLQREIKLLPLLQHQLSAPIPNYTYIANARENEYSFAGYQKISGTSLTHGGYRLAWTGKLAQGLALFLRKLHSIKITGEISNTVSREWTTRSMQKHHHEIRSKAYRYLDPNTREIMESFFRKSISLLDQSNYDHVLAHTDLTDRNILINTDNGRLAGILDWGGCRITDPALDFCGLFEVNRGLGYETLKGYGNTSQHFLERVDVYWRMLPYFEILYGLHEGHDELKRHGLRRVRQRLAAPGLDWSQIND